MNTTTTTTSEADNKRKQLTALRRELRSTGSKERRRELQTLISLLEAEPVSLAGGEAEFDDDDDGMARRERARAKRREREAEAAAESARIKSASLEAIRAGPQLDIKETEQLSRRLEEHGLDVHSVKPDGNCLFAAISHQLSLHSICKTDRQLRELVAGYILANPDKYGSFIDYEEHQVQDLESYCSLVARDGWWGGEVELDAMACALGCRISVLKADGLVEYNECSSNNHSLRLMVSYHRHLYCLGAHYNSLLYRKQ